MAPLTSSFIADVGASFLAKFEQDLGRGSTLYPTPGYLQLASFHQGTGMPNIVPPEDEQPAVWVEYLAGGRSASGIGRLNYAMVESFNCYTYLKISPDVLGEPGMPLEDFRIASIASADTLMRRVWNAIEGWSDAITCPIIGGTSNGAVVSVWSMSLSGVNDFLLEGRSLIGLDVHVE